MFEQVKEKLNNDYNSELTRFNVLKEEMDKLELQFKDDDTEKLYQNDLKDLNKKYNIFKRGKEYKEELKKLQEDYFSKLKQYELEYKHYIDIKNEAAKINVYVLQKKLENLENASSLEDLKMTEQDAVRILTGES